MLVLLLMVVLLKGGLRSMMLGGGGWLGILVRRMCPLSLFLFDLVYGLAIFAREEGFEMFSPKKDNA